MPDSPDFTALVVNHFLQRRQRGVAVSSVDQQLLLRWERQQVPLHVVVQGIDDAFDRLAEAPRSLVSCARFVSQRARQFAADAAQANGGQTAEAPSSSPPPPRRRLDERLRDAAEAAQHVAFRQAFAELAAEVAEILAEHPAVPTHLFALLDQALVEATIERLDADERAEVEAAAAAALAELAGFARMSDEAKQQRKIHALREVLSAIEPWPI